MCVKLISNRGVQDKELHAEFKWPKFFGKRSLADRGYELIETNYTELYCDDRR
jgi:hypothetical protein